VASKTRKVGKLRPSVGADIVLVPVLEVPPVVASAADQHLVVVARRGVDRNHHRGVRPARPSEGCELGKATKNNFPEKNTQKQRDGWSEPLVREIESVKFAWITTVGQLAYASVIVTVWLEIGFRGVNMHLPNPT